MSNIDPAVAQRLLLGHIATLGALLRETNASLAGVVRVLRQKGAVTADEWTAAVEEFKADAAIERATNPRHRILAELYNRRDAGEDVCAEIDRLIRETMEDPPEP